MSSSVSRPSPPSRSARPASGAPKRDRTHYLYIAVIVAVGLGIAVGFATNMPQHNLVEVVGAALHLIAHPDCSLDDLMKFVPGPDLPLGGRIVGLDGIRDAYLTGKGSFRTRATVRIEKITPRRSGIVVTELGIKDVILPGEMRELINRVVEAEKVAQANLIRRREETAATRSLLNTARLMEDNPTLLRLKELEALERVTEKIGRIDVHASSGEGLHAVVDKLVTLRPRD